MSDINDTTFVLTLCNRPDLLTKTLSSLRENTSFVGIAKIVIIEDSGNEEIAQMIPEIFQNVPVTFLQNGTNEGQIYSIERAYAEVETPYVFHCEDDWFFPSSLFMEESRAILDAFPDVSTVMMRDVKTFKINNYFSDPIQTLKRQGHENIEFWLTPFKDEFIHGYYSFNPGLRRMEDLAKLSEKKGFATPFGPEKNMSLEFKEQLKMRMAFLEKGDVNHIG